MDNTFHVFTDGSVIGNPGPGGWAAVLMSGYKRWEMSGSSPWTTILEMELLATCIRDDKPSNDAIKEAATRFEEVAGAQVKRGIHLRIA